MNVNGRGKNKTVLARDFEMGKVYKSKATGRHYILVKAVHGGTCFVLNLEDHTFIDIEYRSGRFVEVDHELIINE